MNAQQEPAPFVKVAEVTLRDGRFAGFCRTKVEHMVVANTLERLHGPEYYVPALISQIVQIDDQAIKLSDVMALDCEDYELINKTALAHSLIKSK